MPLNTANMVLNGQIAHQDIKQYADLLTGVMTDQPVTVTNTLTATTFVGNGAVPSGGAAGQVLSKGSAANYNLGWTTPFSQANADSRYLPLTGGTLSGPLLFSPDNTSDIGTSGATRPRNLYVGGTAVVGSGSPLTLGASGSAGFVTSAVGGSLILGANSQGRWSIDFTTGSFLAQTDNAWDIGASGANRPRTVYAGTSVVAPAFVAPTFNASVSMTSPIYYVGVTTRQIHVITGSGYDILTVENQTGSDIAYVDLVADEACEMWFNYNRATATYNSASRVWGRLIAASSYSNGVLSWETGAAGSSTLSSRFQVSWQGNATLSGTLTVAGAFSAGPGNSSIGGSLTITGAVTANSTLAVASSLYLTDGNNYLLNSGGSLLIRTGGYVSIQNPSGSANAPVYVGTLQATSVIDTGAMSVTGTLAVTGGATFTATSTFNNGLLVGGGTLNVNNLTIQFCGALYGVNNGCYLTNDGSTWTSSGAISVGTSLSVSTTISCGGAAYVNGGTLIVGSSGPGVITTGASYLYLRANNGVVVMDGTGGLSMGNAPLVGVNTLQVAAWEWCPTHYYGTSQTAPFIQGAGAAIRYTTPGSNVSSFENGAGGFSLCQASAFNVVSTRRLKDAIAPLTDCLARVTDPRVGPVSFVLKSDLQTQRVGFIAEDMALVCPEVIGTGIDGEPNGIHYGALVSVLWGAVRALNERIDALEAA